MQNGTNELGFNKNIKKNMELYKTGPFTLEELKEKFGPPHKFSSRALKTYRHYLNDFSNTMRLSKEQLTKLMSISGGENGLNAAKELIRENPPHTYTTEIITQLILLPGKSKHNPIASSTFINSIRPLAPSLNRFLTGQDIVELFKHYTEKSELSRFLQHLTQHAELIDKLGRLPNLSKIERVKLLDPNNLTQLQYSIITIKPVAKKNDRKRSHKDAMKNDQRSQNAFYEPPEKKQRVDNNIINNHTNTNHNQTNTSHIHHTASTAPMTFMPSSLQLAQVNRLPINNNFPLNTHLPLNTYVPLNTQFSSPTFTSSQQPLPPNIGTVTIQNQPTNYQLGIINNTLCLIPINSTPTLLLHTPTTAQSNLLTNANNNPTYRQPQNINNINNIINIQQHQPLATNSTTTTPTMSLTSSNTVNNTNQIMSALRQQPPQQSANHLNTNTTNTNNIQQQSNLNIAAALLNSILQNNTQSNNSQQHNNNYLSYNNNRP